MKTYVVSGQSRPVLLIWEVVLNAGVHVQTGVNYVGLGAAFVVEPEVTLLDLSRLEQELSTLQDLPNPVHGHLICRRSVVAI